MSNPNVREIVLDTLLEINRENAYSHLVLKAVLDKYQYLDKRDRAFISRVTQGTLERQMELDYIINSYSKTPVKKMKPLIRQLLRMSVYQIRYMDSIPDSAVCNEAVKLAQKRGFVQLKGFVNGVLRSIVRGDKEIHFPDMATEYSMPQWIIDLWKKQYDEATIREMLSSYLEPGKVCIRTNLSKITPEKLMEQLKEEHVSVTKVPQIPYAFYIDDYDHLTGLTSFQKGLFYVQDVSSMMVAHKAGIKAGDFCIDVCAAPGGKSLHMAELLSAAENGKKGVDSATSKQGRVIARDVSDYKVGLIQENINRSGLLNITAQKWDATVLDESMIDTADVVIADLPCSGLGVIGKKPDIKYHMSPKSLASLAALQRQMLTVVCQYVKPQGTLCYSTCTIHKGENEDNVAWFLENHPQFSLVEMEQILPKQGSKDGFFISVMKRNK